MKKKRKLLTSDTKDPAKAPLPSPITAAAYEALSAEKKAAYRPIPRRYERLPRVCLGLYILAGLCLVLYVAQVLSAPFSDWFNRTISAGGRFLLAKLTDWLPFSMGECLILLLGPALGLALWYGVRHYCDSWRTAAVFIGILLSVVAGIFSVFVLNFSAGYRGSTLDRKLELSREEVSAEELYDTALILIRRINQEAEGLAFYEEGFSVMPYRLDEMNAHLDAAYDAFCAEHDFISHVSTHVKPVLMSEAMSYMHITGVYSFFTGEANINVNFPDYTLPYTAAHELAHQRGIARENEANFIAFLVCLRSDDAYVRYSGYLNMYELVADALYRADKTLYRQAYAQLNDATKGELAAYSAFYATYKNSTVSKVSGAVNNTYLQIQGTPDGIRSYGMAVDLTVAYYKNTP